MKFTSVKIETANWFRRSACYIGLVEVENGNIVDKYESLLKPEPFWFHFIYEGNHGITKEDCIQAPSFNQIWPDISNKIDNKIIVAHNAHFEQSVFNHLFDYYKLDAQPNDYLCTAYLSRVHYNQLERHDLSSMYLHAFGKNIEQGNRLQKAIAAAELAIQITNQWNPPTFNNMVEALYEDKKALRNRRKPKIKYSKLLRDPGFEESNDFKGSQFAVSGELSSFSTLEIVQLLTNYGAIVTESITKSTTHLIVPDEHESFDDIGKATFNTAQDHIEKGQNISIISESSLLALIENLKARKKLIII